MDRFCSNKGKKSQTSKTEALIGKCYRSLHSRPKITMVVGYWIGIKNVLVRPLLYYRISQRHCNNKSAEQLKAYRCHGTEVIIWFFFRFQGGGGACLPPEAHLLSGAYFLSSLSGSLVAGAQMFSGTGVLAWTMPVKFISTKKLV